MSENDVPIMLLQIDETYRVVSDKGHMNWILQRYEDVVDKKTQQATHKEWKDLGFYHLKGALMKYKEEVVMDSGKLITDQLLSKLNEIDLHIGRVVKKENIKLVGKGEE